MRLTPVATSPLHCVRWQANAEARRAEVPSGPSICIMCSEPSIVTAGSRSKYSLRPYEVYALLASKYLPRPLANACGVVKSAQVAGSHGLDSRVSLRRGRVREGVVRAKGRESGSRTSSVATKQATTSAACGIVMRVLCYLPALEGWAVALATAFAVTAVVELLLRCQLCRCITRATRSAMLNVRLSTHYHTVGNKRL